MFRSTKTYGHEVGLTCCFRQWRAESHCKYLHGYALAVKLTFQGTLDERNWVVDFGSLKGFKQWLETTFDHTTIVAKDDPLYADFKRMDEFGMIQMIVVDHTGCEAFAQLIGSCAEIWLKDNGYHPRVRLESCEVREHGANSAIWSPL